MILAGARRIVGVALACVQSVELCGAGEHTIELTVTDQSGQTSSCEAIVMIDDVTPPEIVCPGDMVLECPANTSPEATGFATATDNCTVDPAIDFADMTEPGCGGTETIMRTWTATDESGNTADCLQVIEEVDTTPPDVFCGVSEDSLWPPNHKFEDPGFGFRLCRTLGD